MINWIRKLFRKTDKQLQENYLRAGGHFGDAVSYIYMGECIGFKKLLDTWARLEHEYADRGFRTISLDAFIEYGGYGKDITDLLGVQRDQDEKPVLHAELYRTHHLGKVQPTLDLGKMIEDKQPQMSTYQLPSTEKAAKNVHGNTQNTD